jgi:hypothetical protein
MDVWGDRYYPKARVDRIYRMFQTRPISNLSRVIELMMDVQRAPPMPQDFAKYQDQIDQADREVAAVNRPILLAAENSVSPGDPKTRARLRLTIDYAARRITKAQFNEKLRAIDRGAEYGGHHD